MMNEEKMVKFFFELGGFKFKDIPPYFKFKQRLKLQLRNLFYFKNWIQRALFKIIKVGYEFDFSAIYMNEKMIEYIYSKMNSTARVKYKFSVNNNLKDDEMLVDYENLMKVNIKSNEKIKPIIYSFSKNVRNFF